eukprot:CAMPEP_0205823172 /NCGR_PEP_ID=MMETSP0206-20130828/15434_1 /ASSEMBLY_ACC=CAM_ASM_000279 /TAXON_ID=36767 /ORGANISM="Euplotes focardii, Strain TN1" /LENGTH=192 /DNA_ID=CAMNT_0053120103 /DNA_START=5 /DNA_END=583 /DNA_ORIENTATION=+
MANHGPSYGLDAELAAKRAAKYDKGLEDEVKQWIQGVTGTAINDPEEDLKSGIVLCDLLNKIKPSTVGKVNRGRMPFLLMENINSFLLGCKALGVPDTDLFMTVDLFEGKNMNQVVQCIHALGRHSRKVAGFAGPYIGPKLADARQVEFTEEQLRQGANILPQQTTGSHGNANAKGMFDTSREIVKGPGRRH